MNLLFITADGPAQVSLASADLNEQACLSHGYRRGGREEKMAGRKSPVLFIVDDEPQVLRALQRIFEQEGCRVHVFDSALAARKAISRERPNLVISDNCMSKVEGLALLQEIRKAFPKTRTMLLTGGFIDDRSKSAVATGEIDALIQKPWDLNDLIEHVRELIDKPASS